MAKPKHSPALFEVISQSRPRIQQKRPGLLRSISQLFRPRQNGIPSALLEPTTPAVAPEREAPAAIEPAATLDRLQPLDEPASPPERRPALMVDSDRYEITVRLSYASAIIGFFAVLTLVGAAFLAGRNTGPKQPVLFAGTTSEDLRSQMPVHDVLNLQGTSVDVPPSIMESHTSVSSPSEASTQQPAQNSPRVAGLNYVIVQSYPEQEKEMAEEAARVLTENGIPCTVVQSLEGWSAKNWYTVVGLQGFDRISNSPQYNAYVKKIKEVSDRYAKKGSFKAFTPTAYKWR